MVFCLNKSISLSKYWYHQKININIHQDIYYSFFSELQFFKMLILFILSHFLSFTFCYLAFIMVKDIGQTYKHSQSQISTPSIKEPVL